MLPANISTPIHTAIDEWHIAMRQNQKVHRVILTVFLKRIRDIEHPKVTFKFEASISPKCKPETREALGGMAYRPAIEADDLPSLRTQCLQWVKTFEIDEWDKVIAVVIKKEGDNIRFNWATGERSKCGHYYRRLGASWVDTHASHLLSGFEVTAVHPWSAELEATFKDVDTRFDKLVALLGQQLQKPAELINFLQRQLPNANSSPNS